MSVFSNYDGGVARNLQRPWQFREFQPNPDFLLFLFIICLCPSFSLNGPELAYSPQLQMPNIPLPETRMLSKTRFFSTREKQPQLEIAI